MMIKRVLSWAMALTFVFALAGCGQTSPAQSASIPASGASSEAKAASDETSSAAALRVAGLKGPTTMGLVNLIAASEAGQTEGDYAFAMYGSADEIVPLLVQGEVDLAAVPCNLAATLYQKTGGEVQVMAVNTLGVLYVLERGQSIESVADLKGCTILTTGKGTTPEYVLRYLLKQNGIDPDADVDVQFFSEATEVVARMESEESGPVVAMLPQPFVASALAQDENLRVALDVTAEWEKVAQTDLVTGVLMGRREVLEENPEAVAAFMEGYAESVQACSDDLEGTAALCEEYGIVAKAALAQQALPACNIVFQTGDEMKANVAAYLQVLYDADPASVGGAMPADDFYYFA